MSQRRGSIDDFDIGNALRDVKRWYHIPTLVVLLAFMLWVRVRGWSNFVRDGTVLLSGNDAWYHLRQTTYTVNNWPATMPFDPWTYFSYGTSNSQFGTFFDQLIATGALIVGLGDPSQETIAMAVLLAPAIFGTLVAIPVYLAGKRMGGRFGGLVSVLVLALSTGGFLQRSMAGFSDHHVGEILFQMIAVVGVMVALSIAQKERPVWELVVNREWGALRRPVGWSILAGVGIGVYLWVWPPGVLLLGILGLFFLLQLIADFLRGRSPDHIAFVGVVSLSVAGLLAFVPFNTFEITATNFSLLQPLLAFAVAFGCAFMAWLARQFESRDIDNRAYPFVVFGIIAAITLLFNLLAPDLYGFFAKNVQRVVGLGTSAQAGTVGEAQPLSAPITTLFGSFGLTFVSAFVSVLIIVYAQIRYDDAEAESLFVAVWAIMLLLATLTQSRFEYYLVLPIAVLNAYLIKLISQYISTSEDTQGIETFQVLTVVTVLLLIIAPLAVSSGQGASTAWQQGQANQPSPGVIGWDDSLSWMQKNTPAEGTYGGADNEMAFNGTYPRQDDFDYPEGAYGVMSWWDYGHWITERGQRIPNANPFQQGATEAANYLLAPNETHANDVLNRMDEDDAKTRYVMVDWKMANSRSRYGGKFFAPIVFYDDNEVSQRDFFNSVLTQQGTSVRTAYQIKNQRYYDSMVNRLWHFHGSAQEPNPIMMNYSTIQTQRGTAYTIPRNESRYSIPRLPQPLWYQRVDRNSTNGTFDQVQQQAREDATEGALSQVRQRVNETNTAQVGGVGPNPPEYVEALENYRLVRNAERNATDGRAYTAALFADRNGLIGNTDVQNISDRQRAQLSQDLETLLFPDRGGTPPWVKIFERVPGGTIEGTGPTNETVTAEVEVRSPTRNATFTYTQRAETGADGQFSMTVPYSTTGYENWGTDEGYTNVSARATGDYRLYTDAEVTNESVFEYNADATVTEAQVIGEDDAATTVSLDRQKIADLRSLEQGGDETATDGNTTEENTTDGTTDDGSTDTSTSDGNTTDDGSTSETTTTESPSSVGLPERTLIQP
ncbi:oligosaccharyl transferase, archaeosortase A system-associated [Halorientalis salina]|uniref:oligosaccharyl transferase, archaeosortase A system-associated n=1 Tax=Halorientalis salina TaxID=2932266 RepID=UPI0010AD0725|nr:oligosaccharyl transferase, archaeosortase A system-associated [Halorientalis salina]